MMKEPRPSQPPPPASVDTQPRVPEAPAAQEREMTIEDAAAIVRELVQKPEGFPFGGITDEALAIQREEEENGWLPDIATKIDELIPRCEAHGIKVVFGDDPMSGNAHILPKDSDDVIADAILPKNLKITDDMDAGLRKLIEFHRMRAAKKK